MKRFETSATPQHTLALFHVYTSASCCCCCIWMRFTFCLFCLHPVCFAMFRNSFLRLPMISFASAWFRKEVNLLLQCRKYLLEFKNGVKKRTMKGPGCIELSPRLDDINGKHQCVKQVHAQHALARITCRD